MKLGEMGFTVSIFSSWVMIPQSYMELRLMITLHFQAMIYKWNAHCVTVDDVNNSAGMNVVFACEKLVCLY